MKTKSKLFAAALIGCALVLAFTACAGCTGNSGSVATPAPTAEPTVAATQATDFADDPSASDNSTQDNGQRYPSREPPPW